MSLDQLLPLYLALAGTAALIAVVINILKKFGIVKDGDAPTWSLVLNLVGFVLFVVANIAGLDVAGIDNVLASVASLLAALLGLIGQFGITKIANAGVRGVPLIGYSYSARK